MSLRISDFFFPDLIEEQHIWRIDQIAKFYQTTEEEVIAALDKANAKFKDDPRSLDYYLSDSDYEGSVVDQIEASCGNVLSTSIESWLKSGP
jgi:hypothetical protein